MSRQRPSSAANMCACLVRRQSKILNGYDAIKGVSVSSEQHPTLSIPKLHLHRTANIVLYIGALGSDAALANAF